MSIHVTGFDCKPNIAIKYFWSTNRQDKDVSEFADDIRVTLPTPWPSNASIRLERKAQISRNRQILASFASRMNRRRLLLSKKLQTIGSVTLDKTRMNKCMVRKILKLRSCKYKMSRKLSHVTIQFFQPSCNAAALSSKATDEDVKPSCSGMSSA